jgi:alkane 1-monooxygenase
MRNYKYLWSLLPGIITIFGNLNGGWWALSNFIFSLGFLAFIEMFFPDDRDNEFGDDSMIPDLVLALHVVVQTMALGTLIFATASGILTGWAVVAAALSTGVHSGSSAIVVSHELIHRKSKVWQFFGKYLLFTSGNCYFFIEHLRVHHKWVATAHDPASAKRGESLYAFFLRSYAGQFSGAWRLERERLEKEGRSIFSLSNYVLANLILQFLFLSCCFYLGGYLLLSAVLLQYLLANFLLEYTNYIEHYGLTRADDERATELHSWQTDKVVSRFILIDLSRHADHHYYASKPYHTLKSYPNSPLLPFGYATSIYLALLPPVWFTVMDSRLDRLHVSS